MKEAKYIEEKDNRRIEEPDDGEMEIDLVQLFAGMWKSLRRLWWLVLLLAVIGAAGSTRFRRCGLSPCTAAVPLLPWRQGMRTAEATAFTMTAAQQTSCPEHSPTFWTAAFSEARCWRSWIKRSWTARLRRK